jgi:sugar phosphate isomerase/epimerase
MSGYITTRLRLVLNTWTICNLPKSSAFPQGMDEADTVSFIRDAGYEGLQMESDDRLIAAGQAAGMHMSATGRIVSADSVVDLCKAHKDLGFLLTTLHVGTGFETKSDGFRLMEAVLEASAQTNYRLYVETHRATLTQDPRRTLDFVTQFPELYLNADFSHWYAGCEMPYGDFEAKLDILKPVFDRTRFLHGRLADSSCIQVPVGDHASTNRRHFHEMWTRAFSAFLANAHPSESICFASELLPNRAIRSGRHVEINYARLKQTPDGPVEETDRWMEGLALCDMASRAFEGAFSCVDGPGSARVKFEEC